MTKRKMTPQQKSAATKSAKAHGRSKPGLWENVNASKGNKLISKSRKK